MAKIKPLLRDGKHYFRGVVVLYENNGGRRLFINNVEILEVTSTNKLIKRGCPSWGNLTFLHLTKFAFLFAPKWLHSMPPTEWAFHTVWRGIKVGDKFEADYP